MDANLDSSTPDIQPAGSPDERHCEEINDEEINNGDHSILPPNKDNKKGENCFMTFSEAQFPVEENNDNPPLHTPEKNTRNQSDLKLIPRLRREPKVRQGTFIEPTCFSFEAIEDVLRTEIIPDKALRRQNTGARKIQSNAITNLNRPRHRTDTKEKTRVSSADPVPINRIKNYRPPASKIDTLLREYLERRGSSELEDSAGRLESKVMEEVWDQVEKSPIASEAKKRTGKSLMQVKNEQDAAIRALCHQ